MLGNDHITGMGSQQSVWLVALVDFFVLNRIQSVSEIVGY